MENGLGKSQEKEMGMDGRNKTKTELWAEERPKMPNNLRLKNLIFLLNGCQSPAEGNVGNKLANIFR